MFGRIQKDEVYPNAESSTGKFRPESQDGHPQKKVKFDSSLLDEKNDVNGNDSVPEPQVAVKHMSEAPLLNAHGGAHIAILYNLHNV